jgi:catechol 2,3-dioxygenase-like lactoylglutathione lyase family enzyme
MRCAANCEEYMIIERLDHVVLTVTDMERTIKFYVDVLGMQPITFKDDRRALLFGQQKINLHRADSPLKPQAAQPTPGSADLCLITSTPLPEVITQLADAGVSIEEGPVPRSGAVGPITSVYVRDHDANLIEIAVYTQSAERAPTR